MLEVMSDPATEAGADLLRRAAILALLGATLGTLLDYGHVWTGTVVYTRPSFHGVAWWVPLLYTGASLGIGLSHPLADRLLRRRSPVPLTARRLLVGFIGLSAVWFASGALPLSTVSVSLILAPVALALWLALDRTWQGLVCALTTALVGCAVEVSLSRAGLFRHTHQDVLGIPLWLPWIYVAASVGLGNIGRRLAAGSSNERAAPPSASVFLSVFVILGAGCRSAPASTPPPVTAAQAAPAPDPVLPHQTFTLDSKVLGETRRVNVYTPSGYDVATDVRYPVLYMPDGGVEEDFPHVTNDIDAAIRAGEMRPVIVVGIENTERRRDMTGPTQVEEDRKIAPRVGGSAQFRAFIRDELMPAIGQRVRGNGQTAIVGESLAGLFVVETFLLEPALFNTYIALSPSLWWNDQALVRGAGERLKGQARSPVTLYFATAGDDGIDDAAKALVEALRANAPKGLTWYYEPRPDQRHSTIYRAASPGAFRKLFRPQ